MGTKRVRDAVFAAIGLLVAAACSPGQSPPTPAPSSPARTAAPAMGVDSTPPGTMIVARANYDFSVEVDGRYPPDARLFQADARGKFLVDLPSQSRDFLIDLSARRVTAVHPASLDRDEDSGLVRFAQPDTSATAYALAIEGPFLRFQADPSTVRVLASLEREPIVGPVGFDTLVAERPDYREGMKQYRPNLEAVERIRKSKTPITIEAYFGTWCSHCRMYMPKFLRVMQDAANPSIRLTLVGVPKGFGNVAGPWQGKNITGIPAIILSRDGHEVARLESHEQAVPEAELAAILGTVK